MAFKAWKNASRRKTSDKASAEGDEKILDECGQFSL